MGLVLSIKYPYILFLLPVYLLKFNKSNLTYEKWKQNRPKRSSLKDEKVELELRDFVNKYLEDVGSIVEVKWSSNGIDAKIFHTVKNELARQIDILFSEITSNTFTYLNLRYDCDSIKFEWFFPHRKINDKSELSVKAHSISQYTQVREKVYNKVYSGIGLAGVVINKHQESFGEICHSLPSSMSLASLTLP